jgi:prephenate dehydratase
MIGKYHFFIDIDATIESDKINEAIAEIGKNYPVKVLGRYKSANE